MSSDSFYLSLKSFHDFNGITDDFHFQSIPGDWKVIITDVKGSTVAIESGRYKDVNTVGAASIAAAQNAMNHVDFPFVFGGDGATLLIPPGKIDEVKAELVSLRSHSKEYFGLELRVGMVEVQELYEEGSCIEVAKYELSSGKYVAIFRGGGLNDAEHKIKDQAEKYELPDEGLAEVNLKGLSCRWNAIPNKRGNILSVLVMARTDNTAETYQDVLSHLNSVYDGDFKYANPVNTPDLTYKSIGQCVADERRYNKSIFSLSFLFRYIEIILAVIFFKYKIPSPFFSTKNYVNSMETHSDYRKFDDMLRMIIDCSDEQIQSLTDYLEKLYQDGQIFYGTFKSETSLMTCYVQSVDDGGHIHFIDGGDGGYAMAAKQLKSQIKNA